MSTSDTLNIQDIPEFIETNVNMPDPKVYALRKSSISKNISISEWNTLVDYVSRCSKTVDVLSKCVIRLSQVVPPDTPIVLTGDTSDAPVEFTVGQLQALASAVSAQGRHF